jgi:2,4-dienoyl-CoA reductase-like NADH-dependent reductase (Old Yellow Enzyme family)
MFGMNKRSIGRNRRSDHYGDSVANRLYLGEADAMVMVVQSDVVILLVKSTMTNW